MTDFNRKYRARPMIVGNEPIGTRVVSEPSAVLQIGDLNGGFLTSKLTTTQRNAISNPATGLLIWNTTLGQLETFGGVNWGAIGAGGGGATTLAALTDTTVPTPAIGDGIAWSGSAWVNKPMQTSLSNIGNGITAVNLTGAGGAGVATGVPADTINFNVGGTTVMSVTTGKISFNGAFIDPPSALELVPQLAVPVYPAAPATPTTTPANTLWLNSSDGGKLYRGNVSIEAAATTKQSVVATIAARNALPVGLVGDTAYVVDASADNTVNGGAALYVWDAAIWKKISEFESMDLVTFKGTPWTAGAVYAAGEVVMSPAGAMVSRIAAGTAGLAFNALEAGTWTLVQNGSHLPAFMATSYIYAGQTMFDATSGNMYQRTTSGMSLVTLLLDIANWTIISAAATSVYELPITIAGGNWSATPTYYQIVISSTQHGITNPRLIQTWSSVGTDYVLVTVDQVVVSTTGVVTIKVPLVPDGRFDGRITIQ